MKDLVNYINYYLYIIPKLNFTLTVSMSIFHLGPHLHNNTTNHSVYTTINLELNMTFVKTIIYIIN